MEPKVKAKELVLKMQGMTRTQRINNSIIAVEEIIRALLQAKYLKEKSNILELRIYWQSVLTELKSM